MSMNEIRRKLSLNRNYDLHTAVGNNYSDKNTAKAYKSSVENLS